MYYTNIAASSLCLLLSTSISVLGHTIPKNVTGDDVYSLTLAANPSRVLVANYPNLTVETFDAVKNWTSEDVGPDNNRRWNLWNGMRSLHSVGANGFLKYDNMTSSVTTDGQLWWIQNSHVSLTSVGYGVTIKLHDNFENRAFRYINDFGQPDEKNAAIWLITKTKGVHTENE